METNPANIVTNTVIDMGTDAIISEIVPEKLIKETLSDAGINGGDLTKKIKDKKMKQNINITRKVNEESKEKAKKIVNIANETTNQAVEKSIKLSTGKKKEEIKAGG